MHFKEFDIKNRVSKCYLDHLIKAKILKTINEINRREKL